MRYVVLIFVCCWSLMCQAHAKSQTDISNITLYADASLASVLGSLTRHYTRQHQSSFLVQYGSLKQLGEGLYQNGMPEIILAISKKDLEAVIANKPYNTKQLVPLAKNSLVLAAHEEHPALAKGKNLKDWLSYVDVDHKLVVVDPDIEVLGALSRSALEAFGWWGAHTNERLYAYNRQVAIQMLEKSTNIGMLFMSDVTPHPTLQVLVSVPASLYRSVEYVACIRKNASEEAHAFFSFLKSKESDDIWKQYHLR